MRSRRATKTISGKGFDTVSPPDWTYRTAVSQPMLEVSIFSWPPSSTIPKVVRSR
jgi:hypothetical protein